MEMPTEASWEMREKDPDCYYACEQIHAALCVINRANEAIALGSDEALRKHAIAAIATQEKEIEFLRSWIAAHESE